MRTYGPMVLDNDSIMDDLAAYGVARSVAKEKAADTGQEGTPVFGFKDGKCEYEITTGRPYELAEYNIAFNIVAEDSQNFNLIVRKDEPNSLHSLPKDKLRKVLTRILDSV